MDQRGFTLVEVIIYILIVGLVLGTINMFLVNLLQARANTQSISHIISSARMIQDRLGQAAREASAIQAGSSTFGADPGVLSLDMVDGSIDPTVFSLTADDGSFQVQEGAGSPVPLTGDEVQVTSLIFNDLTGAEDVGIIQVLFTLESANTSGSAFFDYAQSFETTLRIPLDQ